MYSGTNNSKDLLAAIRKYEYNICTSVEHLGTRFSAVKFESPANIAKSGMF